ncbi:hypothetical protein CISIN_1g0266481mg, partial [Citrus sinensis]
QSKVVAPNQYQSGST